MRLSSAMPQPNAALLRDLEARGAAHDAQTREHGDRMLNITPDTGAFLALLVRATRVRRILEIGTSNGYSTVWLAEAAAATGGRVTTVERKPAKAALARATFARASAIAPITVEVADAGEVLARTPTGEWDFIFLDADRGGLTSVAHWPPAASLSSTTPSRTRPRSRRSLQPLRQTRSSLPCSFRSAKANSWCTRAARNRSSAFELAVSPHPPDWRTRRSRSVASKFRKVSAGVQVSRFPDQSLRRRFEEDPRIFGIRRPEHD
jgi:hypothetical protein